MQPAFLAPQAYHHHAQVAQEIDVGHAAPGKFRTWRNHGLYQLFLAQQFGAVVAPGLFAIFRHRVQGQTCLLYTSRCV